MLRPYASLGNVSARPSVKVCASAKEVTLLDYGAGNVRSVRNAIKKLGYTIKDVSHSKPSLILIHSDKYLSYTFLDQIGGETI
jgi:hypothetical protein